MSLVTDREPLLELKQSPAKKRKLVVDPEITHMNAQTPLIDDVREGVQSEGLTHPMGDKGVISLPTGPTYPLRDLTNDEDSASTSIAVIAKEQKDLRPSVTPVEALEEDQPSKRPRQCDEDTGAISDYMSLVDCQPPTDMAAMAQTLAQARELIHEYTTTGTDCSEELEQLTGYSLTAPLTQLPKVRPYVPAEARAALWGSIGPRLRAMDQGKQNQFMTVESVTECSVSRRPDKSLKYVHVGSGLPVRSKDYEQRYLLLLDEVSEWRSDAWFDYLDSLKSEQMKMEQHLQSQDTHMPHVSETSLNEQLFEPIKILPLPDREEEHSDPDIAHAHAKLWKSIDEALMKYSQEISEINQRKQQPWVVPRTS